MTKPERDEAMSTTNPTEKPFEVLGNDPNLIDFGLPLTPDFYSMLSSEPWCGFDVGGVAVTATGEVIVLGEDCDEWREMCQPTPTGRFRVKWRDESALTSAYERGRTEMREEATGVAMIRVETSRVMQKDGTVIKSAKLIRQWQINEAWSKGICDDIRQLPAKPERGVTDGTV